MGAMKRAFMAHEDLIEQAAVFAEARPRLTLEAANMLTLLKAASNLICDLRPVSEPYGIEKSIDALVARVEAHS
jgi:hypothetical protein